MLASSSQHQSLMNHIYSKQRHIYDATRKFYLLGRDQMIMGLRPPNGGSVLEIGCGTGRNLVVAAGTRRRARYFGFYIV
jgi:S-adenosylmethionine-diacylgycerolhomoserine-N-methlytransferase